jgi:hypothetical protein
MLVDSDEGAGDLSEGARDRGECADDEHAAAGIDRSRDALHGNEPVGQRESGAGDESREERDARGRSAHALALLEQPLGDVAVPQRREQGKALPIPSTYVIVS